MKVLFEKVPEGIDDLDLEPYFMAYLLFLLGTVVIPSNTEGISPMYLPLLQRQVVNDYAWGAAMLAVLKNSLDTVRKNFPDKTTTIYGFSYALQVFALERFPVLRSGEISPPSCFPLMLGWLDLYKPRTKNFHVNRVEEYQSMLENMTEDQVYWQPYSIPEGRVELPRDYASQLCMVFSRVPSICFEAFSFNRPEIFFKQLGLKKSDLMPLSLAKVGKGKGLK